jgi:ribosomal-protein-alanine N-acetyltransferase
MTLADIKPVHLIDRASFSLSWPERSFQYEISQNRLSSCWVAELSSASEQTTIVGLLVLWLIVDEAHIATIAVSPEFRGKGIGKRLLAHALLQASQQGAQLSYLEVRQSNIVAQTMYEKFGFRKVGARSRYYKDNNEDAVLMTLEPLDPEELKKFLALD